MSARPLFVTRKFPPSVGGMETLSAEVWTALQDIAPGARLVAHGGSNRTFPLWLPGALLRTAVLVLRRRVDVVLAGDALMYAALRPLLRVLRVRSATMVHGLDITYDSALYQRLSRPALLRAPQVIANSAATARVAEAAGVRPDRIGIVRPGLLVPEVSAADRARAGAQLRERYGLAASSVLLLTLGRLVPRKGGRWFVEHVLPGLPDAVYLVAGAGPELEPIRAAAESAGVADRVRILGPVSEADRELLLAGADVFVQPNVRVTGDMEGFGLVVIEAALRGTPVVASGIEGILDAVEDGATGVLLPTGEAAAWQARLAGLTADRAGLVELGGRFQVRARELYGVEQLRTQLGAQLGTPAAVVSSDAGS